MFSPEKKLQSPQDFNFPFTPYKIQQELMQALYEVLENKEIGIFESPTGTGKSLTLTCSTLKWLLDHEELVKCEISNKIEQLSKEIKDLELSGERNYDWIEAQFGAIQKKDEAANLRKIKVTMEEYEKKLTEMKEKIIKEGKLKRRAKFDETKKIGEDISKTEEEDVSFEDLDNIGDQPEDEENENETYKDIKIYFCSRTHSQLSQVVREIKKTFYGKQIRCVSLASRQNLCINPSVKKLSPAIINERCLDMQKSQSKVTSTDNDGIVQKKSRVKQNSHCPYKNEIVDELRETSLVEILDIEDLVTAAETRRACPYYSSRAAAKDAQVIMLPYQILLHKKTRLQTGVNLKNSIVIIDEAHNLLDTISSIYSNEISQYQLQTALSQLTAYKSKYFSRFSSKNLLKINQLIFVTKRLIKLLSSVENNCRMMKTHELMSEGEFFNIDLYQILEFCENTRFAQKVHGLAQRMAREPVQNEKENQQSGTTTILKKLEEQAKSSKGKRSAKSKVIVQSTVADEKYKNNDTQNKIISSVIRPLLAFLESLTECADDGRVLLKNDQDVKKATMKFILLNPGGHFGEIVAQCRSIIIAGGTMQPVSDLMDQLFKSCPERVKLHFYDHVVSSEAVLPFAVQKGPAGKRFFFNFANRGNEEMLTELGMTLSNICNVVPAGIVCFFGSYDYLDLVVGHLENKGILDKIQTKKHVFREPRSASGQSVEKFLAEYANAIRNSQGNGAILFSVVGGRLSEGLNFSDDLGRCVIVVGMPYPNKNSPELQEKIKYLDDTLGKNAGNEYYDNLCMKAVNQCIGRSVRHINDYACVFLLDERYALDRVFNKLPMWISRSLKKPTTYGMIQAATAKFFRDKRKSITL